MTRAAYKVYTFMVQRCKQSMQMGLFGVPSKIVIWMPVVATDSPHVCYNYFSLRRKNRCFGTENAG